MNTDVPNLSISRNLKISLFHLGSGMADILTLSIWNRVMISDLGFAATPISLLVSLRYFLAPLGIWAGRVSDERLIGGYRRLFWIWLGRLLMVLSTFLLGFVTAQLIRGVDASVGIWIAIVISLLLFGLGSALSGSTFLALIYDRAPEHQRGRAVGLVWTFLLVGFMVGGILFSILLPSENGTGSAGFTADSLQTLFIVAGLLFGGLWFFSLLGEERLNDRIERQKTGVSDSISVRGDLKLVWENRQMRFFLFFLILSMFFAFSQDAILEPFAGDVFGMEARITNRFSAYWGSMAILGTLSFLWLSRKSKRWNNNNISLLGVGVLFAAFAMFGASSMLEMRWMVTPGLIVLGVGLGIWNVGTLGLMMDMSPLGRAGTFLGFWTLIVTFARGFGISTGGIVRDLALQQTSSHSLSYGVVFILGAVGLLVSLWTLRQVNIPAFKSDMQQQPDTAVIFAGAMD